MRRAWAFIVAIVLVGLMGWNVLNGVPIMEGPVIGASLVLIAFTLSWWFEEAKT
jgi:hypothetical protein